MVSAKRLRCRSKGCAPGEAGTLSDTVGTQDLFSSKRGPLMTTPLRPPREDEAACEEIKAIGGMRRAQVSVSKVPSLARAGARIRGVLEGALRRDPSLQSACLDAVGASCLDAGPSQQRLDIIRRDMADLFEVSDIGPVSKKDFSTEIRVGLLEGWRAAAKDPDWAVTRWLASDGVPAGLRRHPEDCGIFPHAEDDCADPDILQAELDNFASYSAVENDDDAWEEVQRLVSKGWLTQFDTVDALRGCLGEEPRMALSRRLSTSSIAASTAFP